MINVLFRKGLIYFTDFCQLILKWFRDNKEAKENFNQNMVKMLCGTDPFPTDFRAKKYKLDKHSITKVRTYFFDCWNTIFCKFAVFSQILCIL